MGYLSDFYWFKRQIREKGGIWSSKHVYFSQTRDGYTAAYLPCYPQKSEEDKVISRNWR